MKRRLIAVLTIAMMLFSMGVMQAFAEGEESEITYRLTVYSGNQGNFGGAKSWSKEYKLGEYIELTSDDLGFVLENDKYYPRGFRITGHDNDETESDGSQRLSFRIYQDLDYEMAYGIKGNMVEYTVRYLDENGDDLIEPDTFYGKVGDKPMVAFRYVEGYLPQTYNITGTLKESGNEFVFQYTPAEGNVTINDIINIINPGAPGVPGAAAGAAAAGAGAPAAADADIADANPPQGEPDQVIDIDDPEGPAADADDIDDGKIPSTTLLAVGGGIGLLILIAIIAAILARRRKTGDGSVSPPDDEE